MKQQNISKDVGKIKSLVSHNVYYRIIKGSNGPVWKLEDIVSFSLFLKSEFPLYPLENVRKTTSHERAIYINRTAQKETQNLNFAPEIQMCISGIKGS